MEENQLYQQRLLQFIQQVDIYPVSCESLSRHRSDREWLDAVLLGGAKIVQLRDKCSNDGMLLQKAKYFREKTREAGALFLVNDRPDIALLADADGIHLGQNDLPPAEVRRLCPDMIIGLSCNTEEQAREIGRLEQKDICPLSYYNIGPLYSTDTKQGLHTFLGPEAIPLFSRHSHLPYTVMGGIKFSHIKHVVHCGARRLAVVTAISQAENMAGEVQRWQEKIAETVYGEKYA